MVVIEKMMNAVPFDSDTLDQQIRGGVSIAQRLVLLPLRIGQRVVAQGRTWLSVRVNRAQREFDQSSRRILSSLHVATRKDVDLVKAEIARLNEDLDRLIRERETG